MENENENVLEITNLNELNEKLNKIVKDGSTNKPSEEEIEIAKKDFEEASASFNSKKWDIGESDDAQEFIDYINHFIENRIFWTKNGWMGVIKMKEEMDAIQQELNGDLKPVLKLGYQPMEFLFYSFQNPGGIGFQTAKVFEEENDIYVKIFDELGKKIAKARDEIKMIQFLHDRYIAMMQGYYLEIEPPDSQMEIVNESNGETESKSIEAD